MKKISTSSIKNTLAKGHTAESAEEIVKAIKRTVTRLKKDIPKDSDIKKVGVSADQFLKGNTSEIETLRNLIGGWNVGVLLDIIEDLHKLESDLEELN